MSPWPDSERRGPQAALGALRQYATDAAPRRPARETVYNGITMRSRLEAGCAQWLDERGAEWTYEGNAFASPRGQYLPDFTVHAIRGIPVRVPQFIEVKSEGEGTTDVLERMKVILNSYPDAALAVMEGSWENNEYQFRVTQQWPEPRLLVTYYVYNVPGCDSWHHLSSSNDEYEDYEQPPNPAEYRAAAVTVFPDMACYYEQDPKVYILPEADSGIGLEVWAVAFHKGDACIVSQIPLPWISDYLVGTTER